MGLIQFTENYDDLSTDNGYQFKFYCDKCRNGYMSTFQGSMLGMGSSLLRAAGNMFGGVLSSAGHSAYDVQKAIGGKAHDDALKAAVEEVREKFHQCKRCGKWVCPENCWNAQRGMCTQCAPDVQAELSAAQVAVTVEQMNQKLRAADLTKDMDLTTAAAATCPKCGAKVEGKFCGECGATLMEKVKCPSCSASVEKGVKFCPECGGKMAAGEPKCSGCGKVYEKAPRFCEDCGTKMS
jgi:hypothetical protein